MAERVVEGAGMAMVVARGEGPAAVGMERATTEGIAVSGRVEVMMARAALVDLLEKGILGGGEVVMVKMEGAMVLVEEPAMAI